MFRQLRIRNFAIIESLDLDISNGFIAITGETGAGKSILFDALDLVLGGRATTEMVRRGADQAQVEGVFALSDSQMQAINPVLREHGCPEDDVLFIKRFVTCTGRNRVFINGSRTTLSLLQQVTTGLIDVIGQHASHRLLESGDHIEMLDAFAQTRTEALEVSKLVSEWRRLSKALALLKTEEGERNYRLSLLQQQLDEIRVAELVDGEDERIEKELERLFCSEEIRDRTQSALQILRDQDGSVLDLLSSVMDCISRITHAVPELDVMLDPLSEVRIQLEEMCHDLRSYSETGEVGIEEVELLQSRVEQITLLKKRHGGSLQDVLRAADNMVTELDQLHGDNVKLKEIEKTIEILEIDLIKRCRQLSIQRQSAAFELSRLIESELRELSMPNCRFRVNFRFFDGTAQPVETVLDAHITSIRQTGLDHIEFEISPNPGEGFKSLAKVASGGELSRILLALKGAMIQTDSVSSYVFDEVDTGIGGGVAETVGRKLQRLGEARQVICITHLPQVACCAHQHIHIQKQVRQNRTHSTLRYLNFEDRIVEVGRMLGGAELTEMTKAHAQELLLKNQPLAPQPLRLLNEAS
ncbi:MAG: DNA repair protein RecN [Myxococcota bacterium]